MRVTLVLEELKVLLDDFFVKDLVLVLNIIQNSDSVKRYKMRYSQIESGAGCNVLRWEGTMG